MGRKGSIVDDRCEGCGRSVAERFPGEWVPAFCESCNADFNRELRSGHVTDWSGNGVLPLAVSDA